MEQKPNIEVAQKTVSLSSSVGKSCPGCGVSPGQLHACGCDIELCPDCGGQMFCCDCKGSIEMPRLAWTGEWPGKMECREFGWYAKFVPDKGWVECSSQEEGAFPDLNRLLCSTLWDKAQGRFVLPADSLIV